MRYTNYVKFIAFKLFINQITACLFLKKKFMKNPFEKNDHKALIAGILAGTAIAGTVAYLFLTESGGEIRKELTGHINRIADAISGKQAEPGEAHHADYLQHSNPKQPKSDKAKLQEYADAIAHPPAHNKSDEAV